MQLRLGLQQSLRRIQQDRPDCAEDDHGYFHSTSESEEQRCRRDQCRRRQRPHEVQRRRERVDQKPVPGDHDRHDHAKNARDDPATQRTAKGVSRRLAQSVGAPHVPGRREHAPRGRQEDRADKFTLGDDVPGEDGQCWYDEPVRDCPDSGENGRHHDVLQPRSSTRRSSRRNATFTTVPNTPTVTRYA
jgi:hypothetical protein